jgi:hypothetical protein
VRSLSEYVRIFALAAFQLSGSILDCAAGPASFNFELTAGDHAATSCDPLYRFTAEGIRSRIDAAYDTMIVNVRTARHEFVWRKFASPERLGETRMAAMDTFLADFPHGLEEGRYLDRSLPHSAFVTGSSTSLSARTSFSPTPNGSPSISTSPPSEKCAGSRPRRVSFRS